MRVVLSRQLVGALGTLAICAALLVEAEQLAGAAPVVAMAGGPYAIVEGGTLVLDGSGSAGPPTTWSWDLDNDGQYDDATGVNPTVSWATLSSLGIDDDGSYPIGLEVTDGMTTSTDSATLTVSNAAPTITVSGSGTAFVGLVYDLTVTTSDPGDDTVSSWVITWGDGAVDSGAGAPPTPTSSTASPAT